MKKATVKITFDEDVDVVDALYHISMLQKYKNALFEIKIGRASCRERV